MKPLPFHAPSASGGRNTRTLLEELEAALAETLPEEVPAIVGDLERMKTALLGRILARDGELRERTQAEERLLSTKEAAERLSLSTDWLYRNASRLPFTVRIGGRHLRFSATGIEKFIRQRVGRS